MNRELLIHAYEVIDGIPDKNFNLQFYFKSTFDSITRLLLPPEPKCGTIACAAGWLSMHPDFQLDDYTPVGTTTLMYEHNMSGQVIEPFKAMAKLFDITVGTAEDIFTSADGRRDTSTHKELWKARVRDVLEHGYVHEKHRD